MWFGCETLDMRYQCEDNCDLFMEYMGKINDVIEESSFTHIIIIYVV